MILELSSALFLMAVSSTRPDEQFDGENEQALVTETDTPVRRRTSSLRGEGYALTGFDSNIELSSRDVPSTGVLRLGGELEYARYLPWGLVAIGDVNVDGSLWRTAATGVTLLTRTELTVGGFVFGRGKIRRIGSSSEYPRLRVLVTARHEHGPSFAGSVAPNSSPTIAPLPEDGSEEAEEGGTEASEEAEEAEEQLDGSPVDEPVDADAGSRQSAAFMDPFHRITAETRVRLDATRRLRLELRPRLIRAFIDGDAGSTGRDFTQVEARLALTYDVFGPLLLRAAYRLERRMHDDRSNDFGEALVFNTHRVEATMFLAWTRLALRLHYRMRNRLINDPGRDRIRHGLSAMGEYRLTDTLSAVAEVAYMAEDRIGRADRDWNRLFAFGGILFNY